VTSETGEADEADEAAEGARRRMKEDRKAGVMYGRKTKKSRLERGAARGAHVGRIDHAEPLQQAV
jgi:hypothetical protein